MDKVFLIILLIHLSAVYQQATTTASGTPTSFDTSTLTGHGNSKYLLNVCKAIQKELTITRNKLSDANNELIMTRNKLSDVQNELKMIKNEMKKLQTKPDDVNNKPTKRQPEWIATRHQRDISPAVCPTPFPLTSPPQGFTYATVYQNHRYILSDLTTTNVTAFQAKCQQIGGYLVEFGTMEELNHVSDFLKDLGTFDAMVGLTDEGHEGQWTYITAQCLSQVLPWYDGYPQNGRDRNGRQKNCANLLANSKKLIDYYCFWSYNAKFLCEIDM